MEICDLPRGEEKQPVSYPHFPTRWQAVLWRNWGLVPEFHLTNVLQCTLEQLRQAAIEMGLPEHPRIEPRWLTHGYLTLIRNNWHLLPYSQMLQLLNWTSDRLNYSLLSEDFLWAKCGMMKPVCTEVRYAPLTEDQHRQTKQLRLIVQKYFPVDHQTPQDMPFAFMDRYGGKKARQKKTDFEFNFIHAYSASCGDILSSESVIPESLLAQYASMGIKGIWFHALLHLLYPIPGAEEFTTGAETRLKNLCKIIADCAKYGLKVYLYFNEPRCMPYAFYEKKPLWAGIDLPQKKTKTVCTTRSPEPLQWLESSMKALFTDARGLGGIFCITMSENPTNCHYGAAHENCPSCREHAPEEIIAGVISAMERGMHAADPEAKMIAYDWGWCRDQNYHPDNLEFKCRVMDLLPKNIYVESVSEWGMITHIGGVDQYLMDYSISQVGPSKETLGSWEYAHKIGLKIVAKVQLNNSWEVSAVPFIPVPYLIQEHLRNLYQAGVSGLMLSWTLGGYPGGNLALLQNSPEEIAAEKFKPELAEKICLAWKQFSNAFREFPFYVGVIYKAPMNYGPMNLLHLNPTGYKATMVGFPYDDLDGWRGVYPEDVLEKQFRILTEGWKKGLETLESAKISVSENERAAFLDIQRISEAAYCHLRSTYHQICFVRARSRVDVSAMLEHANEERKIALKLYELVRMDSRIGFEASNHYYYSLNDLREKVISCAEIIKKLTIQ